MLDKIDVSRVVWQHLKTWRNYSTDRWRPYDYILFVVIPLVTAIVLVNVVGPLPKNLIGVVVTSLSVFTGLLLNLLILAVNTSQNLQQSLCGRKKRLRQDLLHEVFINSSFAVLVAISTASFTLFLGVLGKKTLPFITSSLSVIIYFLGGLFLLTLIMILDRVFALLSDTFPAYGNQELESE